ncbi:GNAT family N-acetyltransferase [Streptomyces sp. NPDC005963]|uniref:GNAT family N-acetyltransferase n=1 Tax=Streptomyces sp. NPDC005963 TaxID=3156721 RepID=UPI00340C0ACD
MSPSPTSTPPTGPPHLALGPHVGIREITHADGTEFIAAARASTAHHRPWLFPPLTPSTYATYAQRLIDDPGRMGFLVYERLGGGGHGGDPSRTGPAHAHHGGDPTRTPPEPARHGGDPSRTPPDPVPDRLAGFININNIVHGSFRCGALGYGAFGHAVGRGLLSEALDLVVRHAFGPLGLHRLEANIQPANHASLALVRRAGFRLEGLSPAFLHVDGAWRDHERWALTSEMVEGPSFASSED